jgi:hypothetical protein
MDADEPAAAHHPVRDRAIVETGREELAARDHPVLARGELRDEGRGR